MTSPLPIDNSVGVVVYTPKEALETMRAMQRLVDAAIRDPYVVHVANQIISGARSRDWSGQVEQIRDFMDCQFVFVDNPIGMQRVQPPAAMLEDIAARGFTQGACNDAATLIATIGMADGLPARFRAVAFGTPSGDADADAEVPFTHVVADLFDGSRWVMLDTTRPYWLDALPTVLRTETLDLWS